MSPERKIANKLLKKWAIGIRGDVLSVGSGTDDDGSGRTYRTYFKAADSYTTSEPFQNAYCDLVLDVRDMLAIHDESYDCVFCFCVLEHVDDYMAGFKECHRVLRKDGKLILGLPLTQKLHKVPQDFWRFTEYGIRYMADIVSMSVERIIPIGGVEFAPVTYLARLRK